MSLSSSIFIIGLLPWFVVLYRIMGKERAGARATLILLANSLFVVWGGLRSLLILLGLSVVVWILSLAIRKTKSFIVLIVAIILTAIPLLLTKYTSFSSIIVPLGISFVTFEAVSLLIDTYNGKINVNPSLLNTYLYLTFFPTVTSGPIIRYNEFENGFKGVIEDNDYTSSVERIVLGLCKKVLIADKLAFLADYYFDGVAVGNAYSCIGLWIGSIAYSLQLYFDFSGYSDIAIGIGKLLGFRIRENFDRPYQACGITDFWRRWHMSLTQWFRDYIYIPLGGSRCPIPRHIFNMFIVWMITGLWHGANLTFLIWGMGYFVLLVIEKYFLKGRNTGIFGRIYTLFFVNLLWIPFRADDLSAAVRYIRGMFGCERGMPEDKAIRFIPFILFALLICLLPGRLRLRIFDRKWFAIAKGIVIIVLAGFAVCAAINSTYAPNIYGGF